MEKLAENDLRLLWKSMIYEIEHHFCDLQGYSDDEEDSTITRANAVVENIKKIFELNKYKIIKDNE